MQITELLPTEYQAVAGLWVPPGQQDKTVWDTLSNNDLLDAATSAESESHAAEKGMYQIEELQLDANPGVLLDLGCGYARIAEQLLPQRDFDAYIGVDSSPSMLQFARDRKAGRDITTPMHFVYGAIDAIPVADNSIDTVVVSAVFLHNHKSVTKSAVSEIHRILKPGGKVFVYSSFPALHSLMGYQTSLYLWLSSFYADPFRNGPVRYFSRAEVVRLFASYRETNLRSFGFTFLPKRILLLPGIIGKGYTRFIANPVNQCMARILPARLAAHCPTHHDVVAQK